MKNIRKDRFHGFSAGIIVAVTGLPSEMHVADSVFMKCRQHLILVVCHDVIKARKLRACFPFGGLHNLNYLWLYMKSIF